MSFSASIPQVSKQEEKNTLNRQRLNCGFLNPLILITAMLGGISACGDSTQTSSEKPSPETTPVPPLSEQTNLKSISAQGFILSESGQTAVRLLSSEDFVANNYQSVRFQILRGDGTVLPNSTQVKVTPWMEVHGHGSAEPSVRMASPDSDDFSAQGGVQVGRDWVLDNLYFIMSGPWQLKFDITAPDLATDLIVLDVEVR